LTGRDGRPKGVAFVRFSDDQSLQKAIALSGREFQGRAVGVEKTREKGEDTRGERGERGDRGDRRDRDDNRGGNRGGNFRGGRDEEEKEGNRGSSNEVFVGSLPFSASRDDIKKFFAECGTVDNVNLLTGRDGRSKGIAFVRFTDDESVARAVALNGNEFEGRTLTIEKSQPREQRGSPTRGGFQQQTRNEDNTSIFVGNLSFSTTEQSLRKVFEGCGDIKEIRLATDREGNAKGFAHIEFGSSDAVDRALQKGGQNVDGRDIRVDYSNGKREDNRGGFRGGRGGSYGGGRGGSRGGYGSRGGSRGGFQRSNY